MTLRVSPQSWTEENEELCRAPHNERRSWADQREIFDITKILTSPENHHKLHGKLLSLRFQGESGNPIQSLFSWEAFKTNLLFCFPAVLLSVMKSHDQWWWEGSVFRETRNQKEIPKEDHFSLPFNLNAWSPSWWLSDPD
jgi:hypothetical protein